MRNLRGYEGYRYPSLFVLGYSTPTFQDTSEEFAVIRGILLRVNYTRTVLDRRIRLGPHQGSTHLVSTMADPSGFVGFGRTPTVYKGSPERLVLVILKKITQVDLVTNQTTTNCYTYGALVHCQP